MINVDGKPRLIAFTGHAVERVCKRMVYDWRKYACMQDAFSFLHNCIYYEPCKMPDGDQGFTFYGPARPPFFTHRFVVEVLDSIDESQDYFYRVGYCPSVVSGDLVVAKTLLVPGMQGTPEFHRCLRRRVSSWEAQKRIRKQVENQLTYRGLCKNADFHLIREFHRSGIPQVVALNKDVFCFR